MTKCCATCAHRTDQNLCTAFGGQAPDASVCSGYRGKPECGPSTGDKLARLRELVSDLASELERRTTTDGRGQPALGVCVECGYPPLLWGHTESCSIGKLLRAAREVEQ